MDYNILLAILVVLGVVGFGIFMQKRNFGYYSQVKLALLIVQISFKDIKVKEIADIAMSIVKELEELDLTSTEKHKEAVKRVSEEILIDVGLQLDKKVLDMLIDVAVSYMPKNQK